jgi:CheY-like chemotaxis protein
MKILVAEDNPMNLELIKDLLELNGHTVDVAPDGLQAVSLARRLHPDLVLMDVHMPRLDGIQATGQLQRDPSTREIPVIAFTASAMPAQLQQVLDAGCIGHITKPIDVETLMDQIGALLDAHRGKSAA